MLVLIFFFQILPSWSSGAVQWNQVDSEVAVVPALEESQPVSGVWLLARHGPTLQQAPAQSHPPPGRSDPAGRCPLADGLHRYAFACCLRTVIFLEKQVRCKERLIDSGVLTSHWLPGCKCWEIIWFGMCCIFMECLFVWVCFRGSWSCLWSLTEFLSCSMSLFIIYSWLRL